MTTSGHNVLTPATIASVEPVDEFYYGQRLVVTCDEAGNEIYTYQPLKQEDFLDPQEGDYFVQGTRHEQDVDDIKSIFRHIHRHNPDITVYSDLKIEWGIPGLSEPAPDVSIILHVVDPKKPRGSFVVPDEGTRPIFVLEMVSPRYVQPDYEAKVDIYERAGVEEYIIVDSGLRSWRDTISYTISGYRMQGRCYVAIQPDHRGWIYSVINDVWIGVTEGRDDFIVVDARTGEEILSDDERAAIAELRAEMAEGRAEIAEERFAAEAAARAQAEKRAEMEAAARAQIEQRAAAAEEQQQSLAAELARLREQLAQQHARKDG